jgi:hypothetical protein
MSTTTRTITLPADPEIDALLQLIPVCVPAAFQLAVQLDRPWADVATYQSVSLYQGNGSDRDIATLIRASKPDSVEIDADSWLGGRVVLHCNYGKIIRPHGQREQIVHRLSIYISLASTVEDHRAYLIEHGTRLGLVGRSLSRRFTDAEAKRIALGDLPLEGFRIADYPELPVEDASE